MERNIYKIGKELFITSDEEIKEGDWVIKVSTLYKGGGSVEKYSFIDKLFEDITFKKIILTTDQDLINDGVQAIDDEFLEWFVKNPSCESVKVNVFPKFNLNDKGNYGIIIPQEKPNKTHYLDELPNMDKNVLAKMWADAMPKLEPKQETLEEAADNSLYSTEYLNQDERIIFKKGCVYGAKWQQEDMIEKLEMHILINEDDWNRNPQAQFRNFIEQFKKK
jgi:hypothetical protein